MLARDARPAPAASRIAAVLLTFYCAGHPLPSHAAEIVRCGNSYSDTPAAGCEVVAAASSRGPAPNQAGLSVFSIDGVRLGMTPDQAIAAISNHFGIPATAVRHTTTPMGSLGTTATVSYIKHATQARAIGVQFGMDPATSTLRAETIIAGEPSSANGRRLMHAAAVARYGKPSGDVTGGQFYFWCQKPSLVLHGRIATSCVPDTPQLFLFDGGFGVPFAALTQGGIFMPTWDTIALETTSFATARFKTDQRDIRREREGKDGGQRPITAAGADITPVLGPNASKQELLRYDRQMTKVELQDAERSLKNALRTYPNAQSNGYGEAVIEQTRRNIAALKKELRTP